MGDPGSAPRSDSPRWAIRAALTAAAVLASVELEDPAGSGLFLLLLFLPARLPGFAWIRRLPSMAAAGLLTLLSLALIAEAFPGPGAGDRAIAHLLMLAAVLRIRQRRLARPDPWILILLSLSLVVLSARGAKDPFFAPLLALYAVTAMTAAALVTLHAEAERVLDLARVRSFARPEAPEVAGRGNGPRRAVVSVLRRFSFLLLAGGLALAWATPRVITGIGDAVDFILHGDGPPAEETVPEFAEEKPRFKIPKGVSAPPPFGNRLERDEFLLRREEDRLALLVRPGASGGNPARDITVRGECFDYLTSEGRWIRSRPRPRTIVDGEDGSADARIELLRKPPGVALDQDYLVPPGPDRTLYAAETPVAVTGPRILRDGTGNLMFPDALAGPRAYGVRSSRSGIAAGASLADPGPEALLLPPDVDRDRLREIVDPFVAFSLDPVERIRGILDFLREGFVCTSQDRRAVGREGEIQTAPSRIDVTGFLFDRRWGRDIDFASAAVLLFRAAGIPARLATGYREGLWLEEGGFFVFRGGDLAAWVDVPFEGRGWVAFDPVPLTVDELPPDVVDGLFELPLEKRGPAANEAMREAREPGLFRELLDAIDRFVSRLLPGGSESTAAGRLLAWLIVLSGSVLAIWSILAGARRIGTEVSRRRLAGRRAHAPVPFYERLLEILAASGHRRQPAETPMEFARKVAGARFDLGAVVPLTEEFCALRYGRREPEEGRSRELLRRVGELESRVRARGTRALTVLLLLFALFVSGPALGQEGDPGGAIARLGSWNSDVRKKAADSLVEMGPSVVPRLLALFDEPGSKAEDPRIAELIENLDDARYEVREEALQELVRIGPPARRALEEAARTGTPETRHRARVALSRIPVPGPEEVKAQNRRVLLVRRAALGVLGRVAGARDVERIAQLGQLRPALREPALAALARILVRDAAARDLLLVHRRTDLRRLAVLALGDRMREEFRPFLLDRIVDPDESVRRAARRALVTGSVVEKTDEIRLLLAARNRGAAEAKAREVLGLCPGYGPAGFLLFRILTRTFREGEALALLRGLDLPEADRLVMAASVEFSKGEKRRAIDHLLEAYRARPGHIPTLLNAARVYLSEGESGVLPALELIERAIASSAGDAEPWFLKGFALERLVGERRDAREKAREAYRRALRLDAGHEEARAGLRRLSGAR